MSPQDHPTGAQTTTAKNRWLNQFCHFLQIQTDPHTGSYRPELRTLLGLYLLIAAVYLGWMRGYLISTDAVAVYQVAQSLVEDHDLSIQPINNAILGPDGQYHSVFGIAQSVLSIPLYKLGTLVERSSTPELQVYWAGRILNIYGGTVPIFFVSLFNPLLTPLLCLVFYLFSRQLGFTQKSAITSTLIFAFGTLAWSQANEYFQHPLEALCLLLSFYLLFISRGDLQERYLWTSGIFLGLGILTRVNLLFVYPVFALYIWVHASEMKRTRKFAPIQSFSIPLILAFFIILYLNQLRYSDPLVFNPIVTDQGWVEPLWTGLFGYAFSPGRSLFLYAPPLLAALLCWSSFFRRHKREGQFILAVFLVFLATYAFPANWAGGWSWGPRYFLAVLPLLLLPLSLVWQNKKGTFFALFLAFLGIFIQVMGILVNLSYILNDLESMGFSYPAQDYLFIPRLSPLRMHLLALLEGRYLDTWLVGVYQRHGILVFLLSLVPMVSMFIAGISLLSKDRPKRKMKTKRRLKIGIE